MARAPRGRLHVSHELDVEAVGEACLGQQRLGLRRIVGVLHRGIGVAAELGRKQGAGGARLPFCTNFSAIS